MKKKGFTLIELMIVLAIIAITATLVVSNLATSRKAGNETSAIKGCRAVLEAMATMKKLLLLDADADGVGEYPADMAEMQDTNGNLLVPMASQADLGLTYHGYQYQVTQDAAGGEDAGYVYAQPAAAGVTGDRTFAGATDGQVYGDPAGGPDPAPWLPGAPAGTWVIIQE